MLFRSTVLILPENAVHVLPHRYQANVVRMHVTEPGKKSVIMGSALRGGGTGDASPALLNVNITPTGVACKEMTSEGLRSPSVTERLHFAFNMASINAIIYLCGL